MRESTTPNLQANIRAFLDVIAPVRAAYNTIAFAFLAVQDRHQDRMVICRARLSCDVGREPPADRTFRSESVVAGSFALERLGLDLEGLLDCLAAGAIATPDAVLHFAPRQATLNPHRVEGGASYAALSIFGNDVLGLDREAALDWEVRAAATPYESLQELAFDYRLGSFQSQAGNSIELLAFNVMAIGAASTVTGDCATIELRMAPVLDKAQARVGYRELSQGRVVTRASISADRFAWSDENGVSVGRAEIAVSPAAVLQCTAVYADAVQHQYWIADPTTVQNARRAAYEAVDSNLEALREAFQRESYKGRNARELESSVSWLLWMLGFSVAHFGETPRMQDAIDLLATTPQGHFAVIECTTGLLRADNKIPKLVERGDGIRRRLEASGNRHLRVITIMVTTKTREDIRAELEQAERHKILVVTREDLEEAITNTMAYPDADRLFARAESVIRENFAKHEARQQLALPLPQSGPAI